MSWVLISVGGGVGLFLFVVAIVMLFRKNHFKYDAIIVAEVGGGIYWFLDKFGVKKHPDGHYELDFKHQRDVETTSPPYSEWTRIIGEKGTQEMLAELEKAKKNAKAAYTKKDINRFINRGVAFYKTGEGNIVPFKMELSDDEREKVKLTTFDNNQKAFLKDKYKKEAELGGSKWDKYLPTITFIGTLFVCGAIFVFAFIYLNNTMAENIASVCSGAGQAASKGFNISSIPGVGG